MLMSGMTRQAISARLERRLYGGTPFLGHEIVFQNMAANTHRGPARHPNFVRVLNGNNVPGPTSRIIAYTEKTMRQDAVDIYQYDYRLFSFSAKHAPVKFIVDRQLILRRDNGGAAAITIVSTCLFAGRATAVK